MFSAASKTSSQPAVAANFIEDVFSTYLWIGNGTTQTLTNGIDLAGEGGMVWRKQRNAAADHFIADTVRGTYSTLSSNTSAAASGSSYIDFLSDGFQAVNSASSNSSGSSQCSWTFRKQPKFFDIVTYTGTGSAQNISHNLGSVPGMIIIKDTGRSTNWRVYHRGLNGGVNPEQFGIALNTTFGQIQSAGFFNDTAPTSTVFTVNTDSSCNTSGYTYVAYLFAHNAGGFGTSGTDNVISCGSFTGSTNMTVELGFEPQFILAKRASFAGDWYVMDNMRGMSVASPNAAYLSPNLSNAESTGLVIYPTATGFFNNSFTSETWIYMAIRRPMKVPTDATTVFSPNVVTPNLATNIPSGITNDAVFLAVNDRTPLAQNYDVDRLRGTNLNQMARLRQNSDGAEQVINSYGYGFDNNTKIVDNFLNTQFGVNTPCTYWNFSRRPGFFDIVCYTGTGSATTQAHNLGVVPELMIIKDRLNSNNWAVYAAPIGNTKGLILNNSSGESTSSTLWNDTSPTSSVFTLGTNVGVNGNPAIWGPYVAYLFATCPGVSKVGSYTGNATGQSISCGFTGGARFVLIKRTDTTGNWYIFDTANGMTSTSSPYLLMNDATVAQVTGNNGVFGSAGGFTLGLNAASTTNIISASYIFLAIA